VRQHPLQQADEAPHHRIEMVGHGVRAPAARVVDQAEQGKIILPARVAVAGPVEQRHQKGRGDAFDRHAVAVLRFVARHRIQAVLVDQGGPTCEHRVEQFLLGPEVVVDQGRIDPAFDGDGAYRHAMEAVFGKQLLGRVEDDGRGFLAALGLGPAADRPGLVRLGSRDAGFG
jgi:hypothetical protein